MNWIRQGVLVVFGLIKIGFCLKILMNDGSDDFFMLHCLLRSVIWTNLKLTKGWWFRCCCLTFRNAIFPLPLTWQELVRRGNVSIVPHHHNEYDGPSRHWHVNVPRRHFTAAAWIVLNQLPAIERVPLDLYYLPDLSHFKAPTATGNLFSSSFFNIRKFNSHLYSNVMWIFNLKCFLFCAVDCFLISEN